MKKSLRIIRQDPLSAKNAKPKSDSKDHDRNSTLDTCTNNKSHFNSEERKISSTSIHNPTETTFNSQMLCDYSQKENSATKSHKSKGNSNSIQESISLTPLLSLQIDDIQKAIETKERKLRRLEEDKSLLSEEIDKAVLFIRKTNYIPETLVEQHKKIDHMRDQLQHILRIIDQQKLISKHQITQSIGQEKIIDNQPISSRRKTELDERKELKVRSLSPTLPIQALPKKDKFQMYENTRYMNPTQKSKAVQKNYINHFKQFSVSLVKEQPRKGSQISFEKLNLTKNNEDRNKENNKFFKKLALITASTPRQRIFDRKRLSLIPNTEKNPSKKREIIQEISQKVIEKPMRREAKSLSNNCEELFSKFVSIIEGYKKNSRALHQKNKDLEKRVKRLNKTEADEER